MSKSSLVTGILMALSGAGICTYLVKATSPYLDNGQDNIRIILVMFAGIFLVTGGLGALLLRLMHRRWPVLKGKTREDVSLRQGLLTGLGFCIMALLTLFDLLDFAMAISVFFLVVLLEMFLQNRRTVP